MLSVYSGMDVNFSRSFSAPFGLARSRVTTTTTTGFEPQETYQRNQQQQSPTSVPPPTYPTASLSSTVSLVEPMLQSNMLVAPVSPTTTTTTPPPPPPPTSSTSPSASFIYYDPYYSPFLPNTTVASSGTTNVSVSSSPSMTDSSWGYALSTELLPESTYTHTFAPSREPPHPPPQQYMFSSANPTYLPPPPPQHQHHREHEKQLLYPSSSGMQPCDPVPAFVASHGYPSYQQNDRPLYQGYDGLSSSQTPVVTSAIITSPSSSTSQLPNNKRKRTQSSSPMSYSKPGRSASMSPSSCSDHTRQVKHPRHHYPIDSTRPVSSSTGSLSPPSEQGYTPMNNTTTTNSSGSIPYSSMNMISSFPTKVSASSNTSSKRYQCHICTKKFTRPSSLTTHIYSHTKEKPFQCPVEGCGRHFSVVSNLRRHAKIHASPSNSK